jgi:peptidoglycan/xylan/chitin deacetylase (PgdA/CDA1 family)
MLSDAQVRELIAHGIGVGAHTRSHPELTTIGPDEQRDEIDGARGDLQRRFGAAVRTFAYPFGDCSSRVAERVAAAGFDAACGSRSGVNDPATPLMQLRRLEVRGTDTLLDFAMLLWRAHRPPAAAPRVAQRAAA